MKDRALIDYRSPSLARLKPGSTRSRAVGEDFRQAFPRLPGQLAAKDLTLVILRINQDIAPVCLHRSEKPGRVFHVVQSNISEKH